MPATTAAPDAAPDATPATRSVGLASDPMTGAPDAARPVSPITAAANAFVERHRGDAGRVGSRVGDLVDNPEEAVAALRTGLAGVADPDYRTGQLTIAPGLTDVVGVRQPLLTEIRRAFDRETRRSAADSLLWLSDRLLREPELEFRLLALHLLERTLRADPERTWQLLRRASRTAHEWITVDSLAHPAGRGILLESWRWAEIEQLIYARSRWERRLVGSTIATLPFIDRRAGRAPDIARHAFPILAGLIGDDEPDVQKALAWALRSLARVDAAALLAFVQDQARQAAETDDGHRAWVDPRRPPGPGRTRGRRGPRAPRGHPPPAGSTRYLGGRGKGRPVHRPPAGNRPCRTTALLIRANLKPQPE